MNKHHQHIVSWVNSAVWAVTLDKWTEIQAVIGMVRAGFPVDPYVAAEIAAASRRGDVQRSVDSIAVIPIAGTIVPRGNMLAQSSGATSVDSIRANLRGALADASVKGILLAFDSPGGAVDGIEELADEVHRGRKEKPIHAIADTLMASAAYWIGTQAERLSVTPSGEVGSIGVFAEHQDISGLLEKEGVKPTLVSAGKFKVDGSPYAPLTDTARAHLQDRVNDFYGQFTKAVGRGRGVTVDAVRGGFGEGRVVGSRQAVREGMADAVETFDEALAALARRIRQGSASAAAAFSDTTYTSSVRIAPLILNGQVITDVETLAAEQIEAESQAEAEPVAAGLSLDSWRERLRLAGV